MGTEISFVKPRNKRGGCYNIFTIRHTKLHKMLEELSFGLLRKMKNDNE